MSGLTAVDGSGRIANGNSLPPELPPAPGIEGDAATGEVERENATAEEIETKEAVGFDRCRWVMSGNFEI